MKNFIASKVNSRSRIHPEFKTIIKETRLALANFQKTIDEEEKTAEFSSLVAKYYPFLEKMQTKFLKETDRIANAFTDEEHVLHKDFLRDQLGIFFWQAPLNERAIKKPLGYAGDFEMMRMLYDPDPFKGPTAYFKLINALACRCISGEATAARIPYFLEKFETIGKEVLSCKPLFRILNIACGPSQEIQDFIRTNPVSRKTEIHLVDQDPSAIEFSKKEIEALKKKLSHPIECFFYDQAISTLFSGQGKVWPPFDLIYSSGLFDYLDDATFTTAIAFLFQLLESGGTLIIGNLSLEDYSKTVKWYLDDWPLIYRTKEELLKIADSLNQPAEIRIETEKTGVNLFLVVRRG